MSRDNQHDDGAQQCGQGNGQNFCLDQIKIKHEGYAGRHEEKAEISDEEIGQAAHPFQFDHLELEQ